MYGSLPHIYRRSLHHSAAAVLKRQLQKANSMCTQRTLLLDLVRHLLPCVTLPTDTGGSNARQTRKRREAVALLVENLSKAATVSQALGFYKEGLKLRVSAIAPRPAVATMPCNALGQLSSNGISPAAGDAQACDGSFCCGLQLQVLDILHKENAAPCTTSLALLTKESESVDLLQNSIVANMLFDMQSVTATFPDYKAKYVC